MFNARSSDRRGSALALVLAGIGIASVGAIATVSFRTTNSGTPIAIAAHGNASRALQSGEVATVLHLAGLSPQALAAAGATTLDCDTVFSAGTVYCLQAERLAQLQIAYGNLNLAKDHAVRPTAPPPIDRNKQEIPLSQAQDAVDDLIRGAFAFVTTGLDAGIVAKLSSIKANGSWGLPASYLTVRRSDADWIALRGALSARAFANANRAELAAAPSRVLSAAEGDATVAQALKDYSSHLTAMKDTWRGHEVTAP